MTDTYHLTETVQWTTLAIAIGVVVITAMCAHSLLWDPWTRQWSIDDVEAEVDAMAGDLCSGRDQHGTVERDTMRGLRGAR